MLALRAVLICLLLLAVGVPAASMEFHSSATTSAQVPPAILPTPAHYTSSVWTGDRVLIFGGTAYNPSDEIVEYDPVNDTTKVLTPKLPSPYAIERVVLPNQGRPPHLGHGR